MKSRTTEQTKKWSIAFVINFGPVVISNVYLTFSCYFTTNLALANHTGTRWKQALFSKPRAWSIVAYPLQQGLQVLNVQNTPVSNGVWGGGGEIWEVLFWCDPQTRTKLPLLAIRSMSVRRNVFMHNVFVRWSTPPSPRSCSQRQGAWGLKQHLSTNVWPQCYHRNGTLHTAPLFAGYDAAWTSPSCVAQFKPFEVVGLPGGSL